YGKMRKSLGSKRKELRDEDITRICKMYENQRNETGKNKPALSKVFHGSDFGYRTITVERPLQLRFTPTEDNIAEVLATKPAQKLSTGEQEALHKALTALIGWEWKDQREFITELKDGLSKVGLTKPSAALVKAIWSTIGEHDDTAAIVTNKKGEPEPDPKLRDTENIPLNEDIEDYFAREVLPHVPDAWIDHDKTKVGYEIPFTRHFYHYTPPRPLEDIQKDLRQLVGEIQEMLHEVGA
ncbi:MAG: SAM-dependent DNA methyltransferase, partial [Microthrixaceae bacterium]|nr:SAM-dependent DNA methyltransferase [Microthrixaceae bacterium]